MVISIIGILAALTLTGFNAARKNARDAQRKSDLGQYRVALEAYASNNNGKYPNNTEDGNSFGNSGIFQADGAGTAGPLITEYLPSIIRDPVESNGGAPCTGGQCLYRYWGDGGGTIYKLLAQLETGGFWEICSNGKSGKVTVFTGSNTCTVP